jgi:S1-C subfamily serine protease
MDWLDLVLIVLVASAAVNGLRLGALSQVLTFGGFVVGLVLGALLAALLVSSNRPGTLKTVVTLLLVLGLAVVFGAGGRVLGGWSHVTLRRWHLGPADAVLGVVVAAGSVLLSVWLVANVVAQSQATWLGRQIQGSDVLRAVDDVLPPVPGFIANVESFLASPGFPSVFATLAPTTAAPVPVPSGRAADAMAATAAGSMVKVLGQACGYLQEGSGFVVGPGLVVTNAHVVAGEPATQIQVGFGTYAATPVLYDPDFDIAVLRTAAPLGPALTLDPTDVTRGTQGAVLGFPNDGPLTTGAAGVAAVITAEGRDIYNQGSVVRRVYQLDTLVQPGNSGGPVVDAGGQVIGVVFSRSTALTDVGYALASPGVLQRVAAAAGRTARVPTGACTEG